MSTVRTLRKRIERIEAERQAREPKVVYRIFLAADEPLPVLAPGQSLFTLTQLGVSGQARWHEVARG